MIKIDLDNDIVTTGSGDSETRYALGSPEAFNIISKAWLRCGWDTKYVYSFSWLGRPIIQLPEDMFRVQEVIYSVRPDVIVETGIAHGGSLIFYAGLCQAMDHGRVVGIDIDIRQHNRQAIEAHELFPRVTLFEGSSIDPRVVEEVKDSIDASESVLVLLDANHSKQHVLSELAAYAPLVSMGSYIVVADGIMQDLVGAPRSEPDWGTANPRVAAEEFVQENPEFVIEHPAFAFNEGSVKEPVTYWPGGYLKRIRSA